MCGIAGFTHRNRTTDCTVIRRATASLRHRGPNQQNVFVSPNICLGAVRLKIIDLEGGDQPFISHDGSTVVVFNGEIYNHGKLRQELESLGHKFRSRCDTEVVLESFLEWDTECLAKLRGMFAIAIWSEPAQRLVLARDRMGIKPLYVYRRGQDLHFGSELKAIFEHPEIPRQLDYEALNDFLSFNYIPGSRTLVKGITKLPPGHILEFADGQQKIRPYWKINFSPNQHLQVEDAKNELDHLLKESVREHLMSDVPAGIWLSGGVDSSTALHYASEAGMTRTKTFSIAFQSKSCDERRYFREMASRYGTDHSEYELDAGPEMLEAVEEMGQYSDEPGADAGALPVWFLSRITAKQVTVALSGDGGDELFGGYQTYTADRVARYLSASPAPLRLWTLTAAQRVLPVSDEKISFEYKLKRLLEGSLLPAHEAHMFWNGTFSALQKAQLLREQPSHRLVEERFGQLPSSREVGYLNKFMLLDQLTYLPDNILYKVDRMSMAHSLEVRPIFLDHRIVEFAASLPENMKIRGFTQKFLLKQMMKGKLPPSILNRGKKGFDIPTHDWFRGALKPLLMDTLSTESIERNGIFDSAAIGKLIRNHMERRINAGYHLWGLLMLCLWLKRWDIETTHETGFGQALPLTAYGT
jgi:asparagine synthase (glutamine-hydrolysing)